MLVSSKIWFHLKGNLLSELDALQFFTKDVTPDMVFPTVFDAVLHCQHSNSRHVTAPTTETT